MHIFTAIAVFRHYCCGNGNSCRDDQVTDQIRVVVFAGFQKICYNGFSPDCFSILWLQVRRSETTVSGSKIQVDALISVMIFPVMRRRSVKNTAKNLSKEMNEKHNVDTSTDIFLYSTANFAHQKNKGSIDEPLIPYKNYRDSFWLVTFYSDHQQIRRY